MMNQARRITMAALIFAGCAAPRPLPPPVPTPTPPVLAKTDGEIRVSGNATMLIEYRDFRLLVDPVFGSVPAVPGPFDFVFLTDLHPAHFDAAARMLLRKDGKMIVPPGVAAVLRADGFSAIKELSTGSRLLLEKNNSHMFVTAVHGKDARRGISANGYLLEFENGRNIFISGELVDPAAMREFLYGLRDDGKEVHVGIFYGPAQEARKTENPSPEGRLAGIISLFQPRVAALVQFETGSGKLDEKKISMELSEQLFFGELRVLKPGDAIPF